MATLIDRCADCASSTTVTYNHPYGMDAGPLCHACIGRRDVSLRDNARAMDEFYVHAAIGVDFETGEVVDPALFQRAAREEALYR